MQWNSKITYQCGPFHTLDRKTNLLSRLSEEAKSELNKIEEIYDISEKNVRVFTSIDKCCECLLLWEILTFKVYLSESYTLINSDNHYCNSCSKVTDISPYGLFEAQD